MEDSREKPWELWPFVHTLDDRSTAIFLCRGLRLATPPCASIQEALEEASKVGLGGYKLLDRGWEIPMTDGVVAEGVAEVTRMLDAAIEEERAAARASMAALFDSFMPELAQAPVETQVEAGAVYDPTGTVFANPDPE